MRDVRMGKRTAGDSHKQVCGLPVMGWIMVRHTLVSRESSPPKQDVSEGLMTLAKAKSEHRAFNCMCLDRNVWYVSLSTWSQHGLVPDKPEINYQINPKSARCQSSSYGLIMRDDDIMHGHVDLRERRGHFWQARSSDISRKDIYCAYKNKSHSYMAIIEGLNHSSSRSKPRDYQEITLFRQWRRQARTARDKMIPTSREISWFIIACLWYQYLFYILTNLLASCSGSPAPYKYWSDECQLPSRTITRS